MDIASRAGQCHQFLCRRRVSTGCEHLVSYWPKLLYQTQPYTAIGSRYHNSSHSPPYSLVYRVHLCTEASVYRASRSIVADTADQIRHPLSHHYGGRI